MYELKVNPSAEKELKRAAKSGKIALIKKLEKILKNPKAYGTPLKGNLQGFFKARVDPFRILYKVDSENNLVILIRISTRDDVYEDTDYL